MADITLGDYAGYILSELIKAREMADEYSRQVAERYRQTEVLEHFSVPRFKIPKMEVTVPVLVSGAAYSQVVRFKLSEDEFVKIAQQHLEDFVRSILLRLERSTRAVRPNPVLPDPVTPGAEAPAAEGDTKTTKVIRALYRNLVERLDPSGATSLVSMYWTEALRMVLDERELTNHYERLDPEHELMRSSIAQMHEFVQASTIVDRTHLESLLVNPETNVVKNGSDATSVFSIRAELIEEGFFVRDVKDEKTGVVTKVVEFD